MAAAGIELNLPDLPEVPIRLGTPAEPTPPGESTRRARPPWRVRLRDALTAYLPLLLMVLLALGTWWLVKNSPQTVADEGPRPVSSEPDYTLNGFTVQRFGPDGSLQLTLEGRQLHHYPDSDRIEIEEVRLVADSPQAPGSVATARRALANSKATEVQLKGGAQYRGRTPEGLAVEIDSEYLLIHSARQRVSTDQDVLLRVGANRVRAGGLEWDHRTRVLELKPPIRAVLQPALGAAP